MGLDKYIFYFDLKFYSTSKGVESPYTKEEEYRNSQKVFNEVRRLNPKFSMKDVHDYVDFKIAECYEKLNKADQFTVMMQNKTPEDCPKWKTQK